MADSFRYARRIDVLPGHEFTETRNGLYIRWAFIGVNSANPIFFNNLETIVQASCLVTLATIQEVVDIVQGLPDHAVLWLRSLMRVSTCFFLGGTAGSAYP